MDEKLLIALCTWSIVGLSVLIWGEGKIAEHGGRLRWLAMPPLVLLWPLMFLLVWFVKVLDALDDQR